VDQAKVGVVADQVPEEIKGSQEEIEEETKLTEMLEVDSKMISRNENMMMTETIKAEEGAVTEAETKEVKETTEIELNIRTSKNNSIINQ
jgi:hypothetical protein